MRALEILSALAAAAAAVIALAVRSGLDADLLILAALLCFVVVAWQGVAFFIGRSIQGRRGQEQAGGGPTLPATQGSAQPALNAADTGGLVRPSSVTESTTALLDPITVKKGREG